MKKFFKLIGIAVVLLTLLNSCEPVLLGVALGAAIEDAYMDDIIVDYYVPGYYFYDGHYHRNSYDYNYQHQYQRYRHNQKRK